MGWVSGVGVLYTPGHSLCPTSPGHTLPHLYIRSYSFPPFAHYVHYIHSLLLATFTTHSFPPMQGSLATQDLYSLSLTFPTLCGLLSPKMPSLFLDSLSFPWNLLLCEWNEHRGRWNG